MTRILDATRAVIRAHGPDADVGLVAEQLGVTRQTIYRYYATRRDLFGHTATRGVDEFLERVRAEMPRWDDPLERLVRILLFGIRQVPSDPLLGILVGPDAYLLMSAGARDQCRAALEWLGLAPPLPPEELELFARLVYGVFVSTVMSEDEDSDDEVLRYLRYAFAPYFTATRPSL